MQTVSIYQTSSDSLIRNTCSIVAKAYEAGYKILVLAASTALSELDSCMWSLGRTGFLPHATSGDQRAERAPVYIASNWQNPAGANILVLHGDPLQFKQVPQSESKNFEKIIFISDNPDCAGTVKDFNITQLENCNMWREENNKWRKMG